VAETSGLAPDDAANDRHATSNSPSAERTEEAEPHAEVEVAERDVSDQAQVISRSNSGSTLNHLGEDSTESELELDQFMPQQTQSWEFPLSKSEKQLLYTRLCDQERSAAVVQYRQLKRRVSTCSRLSTSSRRVSIVSQESSDGNECGDDEEDRELLMKQRELEKQLQDVRTERRRLSRSKP